MRELKVRITGDIKSASKSINSLKRDIESLRRTVDSLSGSGKGAKKKSGLAELNSLLLKSTIIFYGVKKAVGSLIIPFSEMESRLIAFETLTKNTFLGSKLFSDLQELATRTPISLKDTFEGAERILAFGFAADEVKEKLEQLGNISAGVGKDKLGRLILAFGQVRAASRLTSQELRQFQEAGVPLLEELGKQTGKTESQIKSLVQRGLVGFSDVERVIERLTTGQGRFANLLGKQAGTLAGSWQVFTDKLYIARSQFGKILSDAIYLKEILNSLSGILDKFFPKGTKVSSQGFDNAFSKGLSILTRRGGKLSESNLDKFFKHSEKNANKIIKNLPILQRIIDKYHNRIREVQKDISNKNFEKLSLQELIGKKFDLEEIVAGYEKALRSANKLIKEKDSLNDRLLKNSLKTLRKESFFDENRDFGLIPEDGFLTEALNLYRDFQKKKQNIEKEFELESKRIENLKELEKYTKGLASSIKDDSLRMQALDKARQFADERKDIEKKLEIDILNFKEQTAKAKIKIDSMIVTSGINSALSLADSINTISNNNFNFAKGVGIAKAFVSMYVGMNKALELPPPASYIEMAAVLSTGLSNIASIRRTEIGSNNTGSSTSVSSYINSAKLGSISAKSQEFNDILRRNSISEALNSKSIGNLFKDILETNKQQVAILKGLDIK